MKQKLEFSRNKLGKNRTSCNLEFTCQLLYLSFIKRVGYLHGCEIKKYRQAWVYQLLRKSIFTTRFPTNTKNVYVVATSTWNYKCGPCLFHLPHDFFFQQ